MCGVEAMQLRCQSFSGDVVHCSAVDVELLREHSDFSALTPAQLSEAGNAILYAEVTEVLDMSGVNGYSMLVDAVVAKKVTTAVPGPFVCCVMHCCRVDVLPCCA